MKACFLGSNLTVPVSDGKLNLGTWQGVWLCEHRDRAGSRKVRTLYFQYWTQMLIWKFKKTANQNIQVQSMISISRTVRELTFSGCQSLNKSKSNSGVVSL